MKILSNFPELSTTCVEDGVYYNQKLLALQLALIDHEWQTTTDIVCNPTVNYEAHGGVTDDLRGTI